MPYPVTINDEEEDQACFNLGTEILKTLDEILRSKIERSDFLTPYGEQQQSCIYDKLWRKAKYEVAFSYADILTGMTPAEEAADEDRQI